MAQWIQRVWESHPGEPTRIRFRLRVRLIAASFQCSAYSIFKMNRSSFSPANVPNPGRFGMHPWKWACRSLTLLPMARSRSELYLSWCLAGPCSQHRELLQIISGSKTVSGFSQKSIAHILFLGFLVAHFTWLSGLLSPAFCCRLFSTALPLQLLATATKAIYTLPAIQIHYIYYIYLSDLNKTLLFWRPVRFAGIMHSGGSLGLGVTAPTRAANNDPFSLSMLVSREIEFCSLVLVLVLVKENPKNKWTYPNLCIWLL